VIVARAIEIITADEREMDTEEWLADYRSEFKEALQKMDVEGYQWIHPGSYHLLLEQALEDMSEESEEWLNDLQDWEGLEDVEEEE